jgi:hypothetical protein
LPGAAEAAACSLPLLCDGGLPIHSLSQLLAESRAEPPWTERLALVAKLERGETNLTPFNFKLAYTPGPEGYTDYPAN